MIRCRSRASAHTLTEHRPHRAASRIALHSIRLQACSSSRSIFAARTNAIGRAPCHFTVGDNVPELQCLFAININVHSIGCRRNPMLGKTILAAALLVGTTAIAQQNQNTPTAPSNPAAPHTEQVPTLAECWDTATNRVRNSGTVGLNPGVTPSAPQNQQSPGDAAPANSRPPGMKNC